MAVESATASETERLERALDGRAWVSWLLVAFNTGLYAWCAWRSHSINVAPEVMAIGWKSPVAVHAGQVWRLVSCLFLHAGLLHLALNMVGIINVGSIVERLIGPAAYLTLFIAAGVCGSVLSSVLGPYAGVGSSGAVLGLLGAAFVLAVRHGGRLREVLGRSFVWQCFGLLVLNVIFGFVIRRVDNLAHLGGIACGLTVTWLCDLAPLRAGRHPWRRGLELGLLGGTLLVLMATGAMVLRAARPAQVVEWHQIRGLDLMLEVPTFWLARTAGAAVEYYAPGVPARLQVERLRLQRTVAPEEEEQMVAAAVAGLPLLSEPAELGRAGGRTIWHVALRGPEVVEWYLRFDGNEALRVTGIARADRLREYRPVFVRAALSLTDLRAAEPADAP